MAGNRAMRVSAERHYKGGARVRVADFERDAVSERFCAVSERLNACCAAMALTRGGIYG